ncbi:hypothetical protein E4T49_03789 [Aureobasidium sp. EXF-10728]|nr:hypothetical protein E4T49_03789 [Aureobasidium sp. EXF-10728]
MAAADSATCATSADDIVEMPSHHLTPKVAVATNDSDNQNKHTRLCFAPTEQAYNHGSDRMRPLRTMPFDSDTWIGNLDDLGSRVWPHPSFKELLARSLTGDPRFALPDTVAKENRFRNLRLRCCGDSCCPTTHSPFVEYEKPSRLEALEFDRTQNCWHADIICKVVIYPFHVRLSKRTGLQKLFAIVHRHENGEYRFWRADGTYHENYGLVKGNVSIFKSPRPARSANNGNSASSKISSTSTPTKPGNPAAQLVDDLDDTPLRVVQKARALTRSRNLEAQLVHGLDEDPFKDSPEPPFKKRIIAGSFVPRTKHNGPAKILRPDTSHSMATLKQLRAKDLSTTPTRKPLLGTASTQRPNRSLLHVNEICMLAYHLNEQGLKLMYRDNAFTIESGAGSLVDPTTGTPFKMTEQHALYVLFSSQKSLKVIMSKNPAWSIAKSPDDVSGGIILLDFGGVSARDEFVAHIKHMVGMSAGGIGCSDDSMIESMYSKLLKQLNRNRNAVFDPENEDNPADQQSAEQTQSLPAENSSCAEGREAISCPPGVTEMCRAPATLLATDSARHPANPMSVESTQPRLATKPSSSPNTSQAVTSSLTGSLFGQSQERTDMVPSESGTLTRETEMKKQLLSLLREVYVKYPSAQDDDQVEKMALLLKAPLLARDKERVKELKMELKVYLISHHG